MRVAAAVAVALFVLVGLLVTQVFDEGGSRPVEWTDLTAQLGPVRWPRQTISVIRSREKLERILARTTLGEAPEPPTIDFQDRETLLYAVGPRSSAGYGLQVVGVSESSDSVRVVLREVRPALDRPAPARLTFPYRLITIPRSAKRVVFRLENPS